MRARRDTALDLCRLALVAFHSYTEGFLHQGDQHSNNPRVPIACAGIVFVRWRKGNLRLIVAGECVAASLHLFQLKDETLCK